jgi:hypothetical protein
MPFNSDTLTVLVESGRFVLAREYVSLLLKSASMYGMGRRGQKGVVDDLTLWLSRNVGRVPMSLGLVRMLVCQLSALDAVTIDPMRGFMCNIQAGLLRVPAARFSYLDIFISQGKAASARDTELFGEVLEQLGSLQYLQMITQLCYMGDTDTARLITTAHGKVDMMRFNAHLKKFRSKHRVEIMQRALDANLVHEEDDEACKTDTTRVEFRMSL